MLDRYNLERRRSGLLDRYSQQFGHLTDRRRAEVAQQVAKDTLEQRVQEKTAELESANVELQKVIAEHKRTEEAQRRKRRR